MSHDVIDGLRRRLVGLRGTVLTERPSDGTAGTDPGSPASLLADGGERGDDEHLRDLPDGAGCTEIWEHLSERQAEDGQVGEGKAGERLPNECQADD